MLRSAQNCKKCTFFIYFLCFNCLQHSFLKLKILKIHWSILVSKIPQFQQLSIWTAYLTFLESKHRYQKTIVCIVHPPEPNTHFFSLHLTFYIFQFTASTFGLTSFLKNGFLSLFCISHLGIALFVKV